LLPASAPQRPNGSCRLSRRSDGSCRRDPA
jgi:hypothetical protein